MPIAGRLCILNILLGKPPYTCGHRNTASDLGKKVETTTGAWVHPGDEAINDILHFNSHLPCNASATGTLSFSSDSMDV